MCDINTRKTTAVLVQVEGSVVNHGSALTTEVVEAIKLPVQFNCAEIDHLLPLADAERYRAILASRPILSDFKVATPAPLFSSNLSCECSSKCALQVRCRGYCGM